MLHHNIQRIFFASVVLFCFALLFGFLFIPPSYQHGLGSEILPPVTLGAKQVSLKVASQYQEADKQDKQIQFTLFDVSNGFNVNDVEYHIVATKTNTFLFDETFYAPSGVFTIILHPDNNKNVKVIRQNESNFFESLLGLKKEIVHVDATEMPI